MGSFPCWNLCEDHSDGHSCIVLLRVTAPDLLKGKACICRNLIRAPTLSVQRLTSTWCRWFSDSRPSWMTEGLRDNNKRVRPVISAGNTPNSSEHCRTAQMRNPAKKRQRSEMPGLEQLCGRQTKQIYRTANNNGTKPQHDKAQCYLIIVTNLL